jgi:hypothetical protein
MPVSPNRAAMMAMIRNVTAQDSMLFSSFSPLLESRAMLRALSVEEQATCRAAASAWPVRHYPA